MLSILIPTYNYNVYPLVTELKSQANALGIAFEILVQDDASDCYLEENAKINLFQHCYYTLNHVNLGRGNNINLLNNQAKFEFVLILEADAFPEKKNYLEVLINEINLDTFIIFGGVIYPQKKPKKDKLLRWIYGNERESVSLNKRLKKHYNFVFTWNLLLKKEILTNLNFPQNIKGYGYEDVVFIKQLKENAIPIKHIDNKLIHYNNENNSIFIQKTEKAINTLTQLLFEKKLVYTDTKIGKIYNLIQFWHLETVFIFFYNKLSKRMLKNLNSTNPSLTIFDFYKLGYFCKLNKNKYV